MSLKKIGQSLSASLFVLFVLVAMFAAVQFACGGEDPTNRDFTVGFDQGGDSNFTFPDFSRFDTARLDGPIVGEGGGEAIDDGGDGGDDQLVDVISSD